MSTKPKQATKPYTTTNKILNILGIIILAVIPQPFIDAYFLVKEEWAKPVATATAPVTAQGDVK